MYIYNRVYYFKYSEIYFLIICNSIIKYYKVLYVIIYLLLEINKYKIYILFFDDILLLK